jgi:hypothetical protein
MFVFTKVNNYFVYIDIPIPIGTFIRKQIINDLYQVIKHYWFIKEESLDLAHIPYKMRKEYIHQDFEHKYITFCLDPYQKFISTFLNTTFSDEMSMKDFIMNVLSKEEFEDYHYTRIHFYPQYKFITDVDGSIGSEIQIFKLENYKNDFIKFTDKLELTHYDISEYFDAESLAKFNEIYKKDFEVFQYDKIIDLATFIHSNDKIILEPITNNIIESETYVSSVPTNVPKEVPLSESESESESVSESVSNEEEMNPLKRFRNTHK